MNWVLQDLEPPDPARLIVANGVQAILDQLQKHGLGGGSQELATLPTEMVQLDPRRFQFKFAGRGGTTAALRDAATYNPDLAGVLTVWRDPANGGIYVVNGHHRLALALRVGVERVNVRFLQARSAVEARTIGALQNIAEDRGTAVDAAKLLRDAQMAPRDVAAYGVPLGGRLMALALELAALPGELFEACAMGELPVDLAAAIGSAGGEPQIMRDLHRAAKAGKWSAAKAREAADVATFARVQVVDCGGFLPGLMEQLSSDLEQLLEIRAAVRARLRSEIVALSFAARPKAAAHLERAGNLIDREGSHAARARAQTGLELFAALVNQAGPLCDLLNLLACEIEPGRSAAVIVEEHLDLLRDALRAEMG